MERHSDLRLIAHHGAGMVPHFSARLAMGPGFRQTQDTLRRPPLEYFHRFYADTALFGAPHAVRCALDFFGPEHMLFGTDMPLGGPNVAQQTVEDLEAAGLSEADLAMVLSGNASRILGVS
jgi:aminocarboxymuconate-semialdehyde decarboxylase